MKLTMYLLVYDMNHVLSDKNCVEIGLPLGSTYDFFKSVLGEYNGYPEKKNGVDIWVFPFWDNSNLEKNNIPGVDELLTLEELNNFGFDIIEE